MGSLLSIDFTTELRHGFLHPASKRICTGAATKGNLGLGARGLRLQLKLRPGFLAGPLFRIFGRQESFGFLISRLIGRTAQKESKLIHPLDFLFPWFWAAPPEEKEEIQLWMSFVFWFLVRGGT